MRKLTAVLVVSLGIFLFHCSPTDPDIGSPPATPTFTAIATNNPNYVVFSVTSTDCFLYNWDFGNGTQSIKRSDTAYYPFPDSYAVTLTISNKGGASAVVRNQVVTTLDSSIAKNEKYRLLTGGIDALNGKTWVWLEKDSSLMEGEYSDGYTDPVGNFWWSWTQSELDSLAIDDEYVFTLKNYKYENNCKGFFWYDWLWANKLLLADQAQYKDSAFAYTPNSPSYWSLTDSIKTDSLGINDTFTILELSNTNYIGRCAGISTYEVLRLEEDTLWLRYSPYDPVKKKIEYWFYMKFVAKE